MKTKTVQQITDLKAQNITLQTRLESFWIVLLWFAIFSFAGGVVVGFMVAQAAMIRG